MSLENTKEIIEENHEMLETKPKKQLSKAQLDNLAKMREQKIIKKKAMELIKKQEQQHEQQHIKTPNNSYEEDIINKLNKIEAYIDYKIDKKDRKIKQSKYQQPIYQPPIMPLYQPPMMPNYFNYHHQQQNEEEEEREPDYSNLFGKRKY